MNDEGPDQPAGSCSVIKVFTIHLKNLWLLWNLLVNSEGPDQPAGSCSVIKVFTIHLKNIWLL